MSGSRESADGPQHPGDGGKAPPAEPSPPAAPAASAAPYRPSAPSDGELTRRLRREYRSGTADAALCDLLYRRHRRAALAYARTCCRTPQDAEDLVSEAFARTLQAVRSGAGPRGPWRAYLLAVVRHTAMQWSDGDGRTLLTADFDTWCQQAAAGGDPQRRLLAGEDRRLLARSFRALPARWRAVLWHTLVEEDSPHEIAALLGITPSAVASLAFRAREGLREAYLLAHLDTVADGRCGHYSHMLGSAVRRSRTQQPRGLARHLAGCEDCARAYEELLDLNSTMRGAVPAAL
ncbi:RNA polymerase sigma factor [Streptomyces sp. NBC_00162]|uniref:RNA polymerase sigma factor n=1 Tax=Streptomyces sp. NBC_00162 TaxID=2903629 RepID=UPI00214ADDE7|nr:sigma-70 family RNA polymerase sigma factor [Streptomyces sp. NBC_00162]UUU38869.1 sigma-70 family RNA polymerase sigma factor [Streptomyces sp. NBC_00162]